MELPALEPLEVFRIGPGLFAPQPEHATATPPPSTDKSGSLESLVPGIGSCGQDSAGISPRILKRKLADLAIPTDSSPKSAKCAKTQIETDRSTDVNGNGDGSDAQHGDKSQLGGGTRLVVGTELRGESQHCAEESNDASDASGWGTEANPGPERLAARRAGAFRAAPAAPAPCVGTQPKLCGATRCVDDTITDTAGGGGGGDDTPQRDDAPQRDASSQRDDTPAGGGDGGGGGDDTPQTPQRDDTPGDGGDDTPQRDGTPRPRRLLPGELLRWLIGQSDTDNMLCDFHVRDGMIKFAFHCADGRSYVWEQLLADYVNDREGIWVVPSADVDRFVGR